MSEFDIINNKDFLYLTGSVIFEKEDKLSLSNPKKSFYYLYYSKEEFRNIVNYFIDIFSKDLDINKRINFSETIHKDLTKYFSTFLELTQEYIFSRNIGETHLILSLGFPNSKVYTLKYPNEILESSSNNWNSSINFFLNY